MILSGKFYYPRQAKSVSAQLSQNESDLVIKTDDGQIFNFETVTTKVNSKLGSIPRKFSFDDDSCFECPDHSDIDVFLKKQGISSVDYLAHRFENSWRYIIFLAIAGVIFVFFTYTKGIPILANWVAFQLPPKVQVFMGDHVLKILDKTVLEETKLSTSEQEKIKQAFQALLESKITESSIPAELHFRGGGNIGANALAIPNGSIIITDELIKLADKNVVAIQGVLAHEIGHLQHRHSLRQAITLTIIPVFLAVVAGDLVNSSQIASSIPVVFLEQGYNRDFERESDAYSRQLLWKMGIDTQPVADLFVKLGEEFGEEADDSPSKGSSIFSTHPGFKERVLFFSKLRPQ